MRALPLLDDIERLGVVPNELCFQQLVLACGEAGTPWLPSACSRGCGKAGLASRLMPWTTRSWSKPSWRASIANRLLKAACD